MNKSELLSLFSSDYEKYYKVSLFEKLGFIRQSCSICSRFFWAIPLRSICPKIMKTIHLLEIHRLQEDIVILNRGRRLGITSKKMVTA